MTEDSLSEDKVATRVWVAAGGVVVLREIPRPTLTTMDQLFARGEQLLARSHTRRMVADLTEAGVPDAAMRAHVRVWLERLDCAHLGVVFSESALLRVAARFILASLRRPNITIFATVDEAIAELSRIE